jgi:hypothetical protein
VSLLRRACDLLQPVQMLTVQMGAVQGVRSVGRAGVSNRRTNGTKNTALTLELLRSSVSLPGDFVSVHCKNILNRSLSVKNFLPEINVKGSQLFWVVVVIHNKDRTDARILNDQSSKPI